MDGETAYDTQTVELGSRLVYPETDPANDDTRIFNGWDVAEGTLITGDTTVNAVITHPPVRVYYSDEITITNYGGYTSDKVDGPISYWRLKPGSVTKTADGTRQTVNVPNSDILMENARYVKMKYRTNGIKTPNLAPLVNTYRLWDSSVSMTLDSGWHEFLFDIGYKNYTGGNGTPGTNVAAGTSAEADWEYLKTQRFTGFLLRTFGPNGVTITSDLFFDIQGIAFFSTLEDANAWSFPTEETTVTYYNGADVYETQTYNVGDLLVHPETDPTKEGAIFAKWDADEGIDVPADLVVNAQYGYELAITAEQGGKVSVDGADAVAAFSEYIPENDTVTLTAVDDEFYNFLGWYDGETCVSDSREYSVTITDYTALTAKFTSAPYAIFKAYGEVFAHAEIDEETSGLVYPADVPYGEPGYAFAGWDIDEGAVVEDGVVVNALFDVPIALFDATNWSGVAAGRNLGLAKMNDPETGNDYWHIFEKLESGSIASVDSDRVTFGMEDDTQSYDVSTDKYMAFGYRTNLNYVTNLNPEIGVARFWNETYKVTADGEWHTATINFDNFTGGWDSAKDASITAATAASYRTGKLDTMQIRPHGAAGITINDGDYYDLLYIAIFDTEEAAKTFVYGGNNVEADTHTVNFYEADGETLIETQTIKSGYYVLAPDATVGENQKFIGWMDKSSGALTISANYPGAYVSADTDFVAILENDVIASGSYLNYINDRADLTNVYNKLMNEKSLTVAYFGGSVTAGQGASGADSTSWRGLTYNWLNSYYTPADENDTAPTVTMVNAAIGGSGSRAGAFRVDTDVIAADPDLVFIEFAVNDDYCKESNTTAAKYYETVIRKIRTALPDAEIISILTTNKGHAKDTATGMHARAAVHDAVANHYGITSINVGGALVEAMGGYDDNIWKIYVKDSVHPLDLGYKVYGNVINKYMENELAALAGSTASVTYDLPETYYSADAEKFATHVITVADEAVTYNEGFTYSENTVFSTTKIPGYIELTADGGTVEVTFTGTELNVFMEFNGGNFDLTYELDGEEAVTKYITDTNHPLRLLSDLERCEHTVKITFPALKSGLKIGAFFAGEAQEAPVTVTYEMGDGTVVEPQTYNYGAKLVYPDVTAPAGFCYVWSVAEGTRLYEDTTVTVTLEEDSAFSVSSGKDMKFYFTAGHFANFYGLTTYAVSTEFTDAAGTYALNIWDAEEVYNYATGTYEFVESKGGGYASHDGGADNNAIFPVVNFPKHAKFFSIGISVDNCPTIGARNGVVKLYMSDGTVVDAPANFTETEGSVHNVVIDASEVLADSTATVRYIKINPFAYIEEVRIDKGATVDLQYVAAFDTLADAEAYEHEYTAPATYNVTATMDNTSAGTINVDRRGEVTEYNTDHHEGESVRFAATANTGYEFIGWYDVSGETEALVTEDAVFTITLAKAVVYEARFAELTTAITVNAIGNGSFTVDGAEAVKTYTGTVLEGTSVTLTAVADSTYQIDGWYDITNSKNVLLSKDVTFTYTASEDKVIEVRFMSEAVKTVAKIFASMGDTESGYITVRGEALEQFNDYVSSGESVEIAAKAYEGFKAAYWVRISVDTGVKIFMNIGDTINAYPLGNGVRYEPVFVEADAQVKVYTDYVNKVIATVIGEGDAPAIPTRPGYTATEWQELYGANGVTVYKPVYNKEVAGDANTYTLTINYADGSSVTETVQLNDEMTLTATADNAVWALADGTILSYSEEFTFNYPFTTDATITETSGAASSDVVINDLTAYYDTTTGYIKFIGIFELPEGATRVDHGILMTEDASIANSGEAFKLNSGDGIIVGRVRNTNPTPIFVINKTVDAGDTWYGRPYLVYSTDGGATNIEVYGDVMSATAG